MTIVADLGLAGDTPPNLTAAAERLETLKADADWSARLLAATRRPRRNLTRSQGRRPVAC
jgi:hypothetical protein